MNSASVFGRSPPVGTGLSVLSPPQHQASQAPPPRLILRAESDVLDLLSSAEASPERRRVVPEVDGVVVAPRCFCLLSSTPNHPLLYKVRGPSSLRHTSLPSPLYPSVPILGT